MRKAAETPVDNPFRNWAQTVQGRLHTTGRKGYAPPGPFRAQAIERRFPAQNRGLAPDIHGPRPTH
jgi:hypothetical protein